MLCGITVQDVPRHRSDSIWKGAGKIWDSRSGVRVVEGARLEIAYSGNRVVGSNPTRSASLFLLAMTSSLTPSQDEIAQRDQVREKLISDIKAGTTIKLPDFDSTLGLAAARFALQNVGADQGGSGNSRRYSLL